MDGDIAPLPELLRLADAYDAWLLVDDAHGFGVLGPQGRGSLAHFGLDSPRLILMGTLGKAAGVAGAFVAGHRTVIEWLLQRARPYIFTTAAPPLLAHALLTAIDLIEQGDARRAHLMALIARLRAGLADARWPLRASPTAIQPLIVGDNHETVRISRALDAQGIWVPAIRPPTVPNGEARLRISLSAAHSAAAGRPAGCRHRRARHDRRTSSRAATGRTWCCCMAGAWTARSGASSPTRSARTSGCTWSTCRATASAAREVPLSIDSLTTAVAGIVPPRSLVCGWSLGGMVALHLAAEKPALLRGLVLIGTTPRFSSGDDWPHGTPGEALTSFAAELDADAKTLLARFRASMCRSDIEERKLRRLMATLPRSASRPDGAEGRTGCLARCRSA